MRLSAHQVYGHLIDSEGLQLQSRRFKRVTPVAAYLSCSTIADENKLEGGGLPSYCFRHLRCI